MNKFIRKLKSREVITYLISGVLTTIVNVLASYLFYNVIGIDEQLVTIFAWLMAVSFAYLLNDIWVFRDKSDSKKAETVKVGKFFLARVFTYVVEALGIYVFVTKLEYNYWLIKFPLIVIVTILNYLFSKFLIFTHSKKLVSDVTINDKR